MIENVDLKAASVRMKCDFHPLDDVLPSSSAKAFRFVQYPSDIGRVGLIFELTTHHVW